MEVVMGERGKSSERRAGARIASGRRGRGGGRTGVTSVLATLVATGSLASVATVSASAATLNVTGTWQAVYHCTSGACAGEPKSGTFTLTQVEGSSA
jgi:hypothetical protein